MRPVMRQAVDNGDGEVRDHGRRQPSPRGFAVCIHTDKTSEETERDRLTRARRNRKTGRRQICGEFSSSSGNQFAWLDLFTASASQRVLERLPVLDRKATLQGRRVLPLLDGPQQQPVVVAKRRLEDLD